jgi:hypothetical protein
MFGYIFKTGLLLLNTVCLAQVTHDSSRTFIPSGVRVGVETIGLIKSNFIEGFQGKEITLDTDFDRYFLVTEIGQSSRSIEIQNGTYSNDGKYFRVGVDINFLKKDPDKNMFFIGFRYGHAVFDEIAKYTSTTVYGSQQKIVSNNGQQSSWGEITTGLRVRLWKIFWLGYTARMRLGASVPENAQLLPYEVPGYGLTFKKPWWGFSYYVMVRIPVRKEKSALGSTK